MNLVSKLVPTALPLIVAASPALAKSELLADLSCQGTTANGHLIQFKIDGIYNLVYINGQILKFKSVEKDGKTTEVKAEGHFKAYLSKKYKNFEMKMGDSETLKGKCFDTLTTTDDADDTEHPDLPQIIGD